MAKKKAAAKKTKKKAAARRKVKTGKKSTAAKKKRKPASTVKAKRKKSLAKKRVVKKAKKKSTTRKKPKARSLGRPRVTAGARLDQVFQKDYQAREIFDFLGVSTLRELEEYGPDEIIDRLTGPLVQTVQRIRKMLALANRSLANDRDFALDFKSQV